jgi:hypothetical protein
VTGVTTGVVGVSTALSDVRLSSQLSSDLVSMVAGGVTTGVTAFFGFFRYLLTSKASLPKVNLLLKSKGLYVLGL